MDKMKAAMHIAAGDPVMAVDRYPITQQWTAKEGGRTLHFEVDGRLFETLTDAIAHQRKVEGDR